MINRIEKKDLLEVNSGNLFVNNNYNKIDQQGLLSEVIFGTTRDYKCTCGALYSKNLHSNSTCPKCGVVCESKDVRYDKFGKIPLPFKIINSLTKKKFIKITTREFKSFLSPIQYDLFSSLNLFIHYDPDKDEIVLKQNYGPNAIPIKISGIYSLYLALVIIEKVFGSKNAKIYLSCYYDELMVLPVKCRNILTTQKSTNEKKIIKGKIVEIYQKILNLKSYYERDNKTIAHDTALFLNKCYELVTENKQNNIIITDNKIALYDKLASELQHYTDLIYAHIFKLLSKKEGIIRSDLLGKNIDFSARAVVVNDPTLSAYQIRVPKKIFFKLFLLEYYHFLRHFKYKQTWHYHYNNLTPIIKSTINIDFSKYEYYDEFLEYFFKKGLQKNKCVYLNRQPTLWRFGLLGVEIVSLSDADTISVSPHIISSFNMDFDGDTAGIYKVHDYRSIDELYNNSFIKDIIKYDHIDSFLIEISNEARYSYQVLRLSNINKNLDEIIINNYNELNYDYTINIHRKVTIIDLDLSISYGLFILNKLAGFSTVLLTADSSTEDCLEIIYQNSISNEKFHETIKNFNLNLYWFLVTHQSETLTLPFIECCEFTHKVKSNKLLKNLPVNSFLGHHIYSAITESIYDNIPTHYQLYKLTKSKFRKIQFVRSLISIGYVANHENLINPIPIRNNIFSGLTEDEFFESSFGTRKGLVDKDQNVPDSGYMQRSMVLNLSSLEISEDDCNTNHGFEITIANKTHNKSLINRYFIGNNEELILYDETYAQNDENIGKTFKFRSPITCNTKDFKVCKKCTGQSTFSSPYLGVMTGQYVEERLTQLTMSSFHTSGSATIDLDENVITLFKKNLTDILSVGKYVLIKLNTPLSNECLTAFQERREYCYVSISKNKKNILFEKNSERIKNEDVGKIIKKINTILAAQDKNKLIPMNEAYLETLLAIHKISSIYSLFVELLFANCYVNKESKLFRYALNQGEDTTIYKKLNIKKIHTLQSKLLSLLYEPNERSIIDYLKDKGGFDPNASNIFEKIWIGNL